MTQHEEWISNLSFDLNEQEEKVSIITAPPGSGKSTLFPLTLLKQVNDGKIVMLEPRRLAATQVARRMSHLLNEEIGQTVGYKVRFDSKVSSHTRIEVVTEGIFTRMLIADPTLEGISVVIFDEFHERSLDSDLALALTREAQNILRSDLKLIIMSATMDTDSLQEALGAKLYSASFKPFPVEIIHTKEEATATNVAELVAQTIRTAHSIHEGNILAFLPGQADILRCKEILGNSLGTSTHIYPLYGLLSHEQQQAAIAPVRNKGERKIVLSTSIAETSLTIEGITVVIDSGLCRSMAFDHRNGLSHLVTKRISLDMAIQRTGRAGRLSAGTCYRLWTLATEHRMDTNRNPEILDADLTPVLLNIAAWGESDIQNLPWLTLPPAGNIHQASTLLQMLQATDSQRQITDIGKKMANLPCHPRISKMILSAPTDDLRSLAADIAAILEEKDPLANTNDTDIRTRIDLLQRERSKRTKNSLNNSSLSRMIAISDEYRRISKNISTHTSTQDVPKYDPVGWVVAQAYPERIAHSIDGCGHFRMSNGETAYIDNSDNLSASDWIAIASINAQSGNVFLASPLSTADIRPLHTSYDNITWDTKRGGIVSQQEMRIGSLVVECRPLQPSLRTKPLIISAICSAAAKEGTTMFDFNDHVSLLQRRIATVATWHPELNIPDVSTPSILSKASDWLPMYIDEGDKVKSSLNDIKKLDLTKCIWALLTYEQQQSVENLAPTHIQVPTGSRIRVDYRQGAETPVLSVRLQECFGMKDTPCINGGKQPVLMELLSPGFKPVQLTQDLRSFWQSTYFEVRKELRRRYPKHYWPDEPEKAEAKRK